MFFKHIHQQFSFSRLLKLILGLAFTLQLMIITYNHLSGFYVGSSPLVFLVRLLIGTSLSTVGGFLLAYPDLFFIRFLNRISPWGRKTVKRVVWQMSFATAIATVAAVFITVTSHLIHPYREGLLKVLVTNGLIASVVNVILMAILEAWIFYLESRQARQQAENLRIELGQIKFEVLKSQINPHFMFNSLNVLSGLMNKDIAKAQQFIDAFSQIYRYVLETIEQPVVKLGQEIEFMRSYMFLQGIRYGEDLTHEMQVPAEKLILVLPPLSLQMVLENAIKHNIVNQSHPLHITIYCEQQFLVVKNNMQPKISSVASTGLGLKNLTKRYALISNLLPEFIVETNEYIAKLPLITTDYDESADH